MSDRRLVARKGELVEILELLCQGVELSKSQYEAVERHYHAVAEWLDGCGRLNLFHPNMYPQGSMRTSTTVRPFGKEHFDLDFMCNLAKGGGIIDPAYLKKLVGDRLKEHGTYSRMLTEKGRCWRLEYSEGEKFHMDITPSIPDLRRSSDEYLRVPDHDVRFFKESAPKPFAQWFLDIAEEEPQIRTFMLNEARPLEPRAKIEPLPEQQTFKGTLQRIVQILKRHRSVHFNGHPNAPISVILTTLAGHAYHEVVKTRLFESHYDVLLAVVQRMPAFIFGYEGNYRILNPVLPEENFGEKWNTKPVRAKAFYQWHQALLQDLEVLVEAKGFDALKEKLQSGFGERAVSRAMSQFEERRDIKMTTSGIQIVAGIGVAPAYAGGVITTRPTFFGR